MKLTFTFLIVECFLLTFSYGQRFETNTSFDYKIGFYNVENLFDTRYDSTTEINTYYAGGDINWTEYKYNRKLNYLYKTVKSLIEYDSLLLLGIAEVENKKVLNDFLSLTPFSKYNLGFCHYDSQDKRGIDVALIYNTALVRNLYSRKIPVIDINDSTFSTRDILYFQGVIKNETIHVFVVHWTSRYRGFVASESYRLICSDVLSKCIDTLYNDYDKPNIIVMGDFNDEVHNTSMVALDTSFKGKMRILPSKSYYGNAKGTLKFGSQWFTFDHLILSDNLIKGKSKISADSVSYIFDPMFILEEDFKHTGVKPFRTNNGFNYNGGFSDHLPVFTRVTIDVQ